MKLRRFILFTFLVVFASTTQAQKGKTDTIQWHDDMKLTWADFKGTSDASLPYFAYTDYMISFGYNYMGNTATIRIASYFDRSKSWVIKGKERDSLLIHEKAHFAIAEIYARKARKTITDTAILQSNINTIVNYLNIKTMQDCSKRQEQYDNETHHSVITSKQIEWLKEIYSELDALKDYSNPTIKKEFQ